MNKTVLLTSVLVLFSIAMSSCVVGFLGLRITYALPYTDINVETAYNMITNGSYPDLVILDVRRQDEYDTGHIIHAVLIPHTELDGRIDELAGHKNHEIIVYCKTGLRSVIASENLDSHNFTKVYNMLGGITAWQFAYYRVWTATVRNVNTTINYDTIQAAIDAPETLDGHTILVSAGTYYENVIIDKSVSLIGEDGETTIVDGGEIITPVVHITANNVTVRAFTIQDGGRIYGLEGGGIYITNSNRNNIIDNKITNTQYGINLKNSTDNTIIDNTIIKNDVGLQFLDDYSNNSVIRHNNFINNSWHQVQSFAVSNNTWDNGFEGNYWSNYTGVDLDHDGIGDTEHIIDEYNEDRLPLMGMFHSFNTTLAKYLNVISDSTVEDFTFFNFNSTIRMYVSNMTVNQTHGFCRVCIPKDLIAPPYNVIINDGSVEVLYFNDTIHDNGTHRWIYFAYEHSTHKIEIIPEFPTAIITSFLLVLTLGVAVILTRTASKKRALRDLLNPLDQKIFAILARQFKEIITVLPVSILGSKASAYARASP